jgi:hypothetical protein
MNFTSQLIQKLKLISVRFRSVNINWPIEASDLAEQYEAIVVFLVKIQ